MHKGIHGYGRVKQLATKATTNTTISHHLPIQQSFVKKEYSILTVWQEYWDATDNGNAHL